MAPPPAAATPAAPAFPRRRQQREARPPSPSSGFSSLPYCCWCRLGCERCRNSGKSLQQVTRMPQTLQIILGSSSASRQSILKEMGFTFTVMAADIDEKAIRRDTAEDLVLALAEAKAETIMANIAMRDSDKNTVDNEPTLLITADQVVVFEGSIREKPANEKEARTFIEDYSRAPASTVGSVLVTNLATGERKGGIDKTEIYFHSIPEEVITELDGVLIVRPASLVFSGLLLRNIEEGDIFYCAGGLMVEHPLVSPLVAAMVGSLDSVMGLPKDLTLSLIKEVLRD
ncbi:hypothetical protein GOP47_0004296 [Adiantum capillus-veneris]|uniref:Maf-like protein n=1 Tax=Adiantum capillus-veneris TaxID=13818 RepID=A0A9D4ZMG5_ADICA|nr:hypothetical protein GOP47_0004296 [Adiantum capillus-veneris]